jgi:predicted ATPase
MNEFKELGFEIQKPDFKKTSPEGLRMLDQFNKLKDRVQSYYETMENEHKETGSELFNISYPMKLNLEDKTENSILQEFISDFIFLNDAEIKKLKNIRNNYVHNTNNFENVDDNLKTQFNNDNDEENNKPTIQTLEEKIQELVDLDNYKSDITRSIGNVIKSIKDVQVYYLGANPSKQSALFSIRDKQNNLAQAINDFAQSKILKGNSEYNFVLKWMKEFEVGENFEIKFYAGEAYEFYVYDKEGNKAHLADKGMGSLQAMMLILRVATIMRKHKSSMKYVTIIVEEPELNLHPALQSKLTRFFHTVNTEYSIEFIIETHSEYLIRQTQLFVAENQYTNQKDLNPNPFKVHYFDVDKGPYEMNYRNDGRFTNEFGTGFFDVNSNLIFDLP